MEATDLEAITPPLSDLGTIVEASISQTPAAIDVPITGASNKDATISVEQQSSVDHIEAIPYDISLRRIRFVNASNPAPVNELAVSCCQFDLLQKSLLIVLSGAP